MKKDKKNPLKKMLEEIDETPEDVDTMNIDPKEALLLALYKLLELESIQIEQDARIKKLEERLENVDDR